MSRPNVYIVEQARVYRANGRRYLSRDAAIRAYARERFYRKHPCECEPPDEDGYPFNCDVHDAWEKVKPRYVRFIRKALRRGETGDETKSHAMCQTLPRDNWG